MDSMWLLKLFVDALFFEKNEFIEFDLDGQTTIEIEECSITYQ